MKTFTATHLNKHAQEVFAAAKDDGSVVIEHSNYYGGVFAIVWSADRSDDVESSHTLALMYEHHFNMEESINTGLLKAAFLPTT